MACQQKMVVALVMLMLSCLPLNGAVDHLVGEERGWSQDVDYSAWAQAQQFHVGDKLVFKYQKGDHNVIAVDEAGFRGCMASPTAKALETGKDVITLSSPGKKWYICGVPSQHCNVANQKLEITVLQLEAQTPEPSMTSGSLGSSWGMASSYVFGIALTVIALVMAV